ncbi:hypothetical protein PG984_008316 [Apiospora sp. TS-2023a]
MFSSSVLLASFAGLAASLPNDLSARVTRVVAAGNPFAELCTLDTCLQGVVGAALPIPSKALDECSAFLQSTSTVTASATPVTVTVTKAPPGTATSFATAHSTTTTTTTVDVSATVFNTVQQTDILTQTLQVTETSVATSFVTVTGLEVFVTTFTETSASVETDVATSVQTITPEKKRNVLQGPKIKGRCKHPQGSASSSMSVLASTSSLTPVASTSSMSSLASTSSSTASLVPSGCVDAAQYASACTCAYAAPTVVTVTQMQEAVPATVTATIVVVTETVVNTDVSTATELHSTTEVATETAFVSATVEMTNILSTTTAQTVSATELSTEVVTTTLVVPTTTTTTTLQTATGTSCPAVPLTCAQPNFQIQIANGTDAGKYLGGQVDFRIPFSYVSILDAGNPFILTFTIDSDGTLNRILTPGETGTFGNPPSPKILFDPTPENQHAVYEFGDFGFIFQGLSPLQIQRGCGPACPTIQAQGPLRPATSGNGASNTFGICNGVLSFDVNGVNTACTMPDSENNFEPFVGLKYIVI